MDVIDIFLPETDYFRYCKENTNMNSWKRSGSGKKDRSAPEADALKIDANPSANGGTLQISSRALGESKVSPTKAERLAEKKSFLSPSNLANDAKSRDVASASNGTG